MSRFISMILPPDLGKDTPTKKEIPWELFVQDPRYLPIFFGEILVYFEMRNTKTCLIFASGAKSNDKNDNQSEHTQKQTNRSSNQLSSVWNSVFLDAFFRGQESATTDRHLWEKKRTIASPTRASDWCLGITPKTKGWTLKMMGSQ